MRDARASWSAPSAVFVRLSVFALRTIGNAPRHLTASVVQVDAGGLLSRLPG